MYIEMLVLCIFSLPVVLVIILLILLIPWMINPPPRTATQQAQSTQPGHPPVTSKTGYVYVIKGNSEGRDVYKIGQTKDYRDRIRTFNVKLPTPVTVEMVIQSERYKLLEQELHQYFAKRQVGGEWFALTEKDLTWMRKRFDGYIIPVE